MHGFRKFYYVFMGGLHRREYVLEVGQIKTLSRRTDGGEMKCKSLKRLCLLSAVFFFCFSAILSAEWCISDEAKEELDKTFDELSTTIDEQAKKISEQATSIENSEKKIEEQANSIAASEQIINEQAISLQEAEKSWQAERIETMIVSGLAGAGIGALIVIILDAIFNPEDLLKLIKADQ